MNVAIFYIFVTLSINISICIFFEWNYFLCSFIIDLNVLPDISQANNRWSNCLCQLLMWVNISADVFVVRSQTLHSYVFDCWWCIRRMLISKFISFAKHLTSALHKLHSISLVAMRCTCCKWIWNQFRVNNRSQMDFLNMQWTYFIWCYGADFVLNNCRYAMIANVVCDNNVTI